MITFAHSHKFTKCDKPGYEQCSDCGSYHSTQLESPETIYEQNYWSKENGRSTLMDQLWNHTERQTCGISKVEKVLEYVPETGTVLEIGCAPGALLKLLTLTGREAFGIEPDINVINFMKEQHTGATFIEGYFPDVFEAKRKNIFDCIIAMDIFEHIDDYDTFAKAVHRLLKPEGIGILMSPIIYEEGAFRQCDFDVPEQHAYIFTKKFLDPYLKSIFSSVRWDRWQIGHELVILTK